MVETPPERWRPLLLPNPADGLQRSLSGLRRFFDIQAGSVWRDVAAVLPDVRGRVLDVGSGAQPYRSLVHPDATYMAIDTEAAKPNFGYEAPDTRYFRGEVWPGEAGFADVRVYARGNSGTVACYKIMALVLPLLATKTSTVLLTGLMRIAGLCLSPVLVVSAVLANASLLGRGGNDCLGYTALAQRDGESDRNSSSL
jgi:hypothetical protein